MGAGLLTGRDIVNGRVEIVDISRRNRNYRVQLDGAPRFVVKCSDGQTGLGTVTHEAAAYDWLERHEGCPLPQVPRRLLWDAAAGVLVLEAIDPGISANLLARAHNGLSPRRARLIGQALANLHTASVANGSLPELPRDWFLTVHLPTLTATENMSFAALGLTRRIQGFDQICADLDRLSDDWAPSAPINADAKWDNILFRRRQTGPGSRQPVFIDWEFLGIGDPAWDIGSILAEYLFAWTHTSASALAGADDIDAAVSFELEKHLGEIAAFWMGYLGATSNPPPDLIIRATRFSAGRLVLKCFEAMQESTKNSPRMQPTLQLAANILERPMEAVVHLLGLPLGGPSMAPARDV